MDNLAPTMTWAEVHSRYLLSVPSDEILGACSFDIAALPLVDLGTERSGGRLTAAVMERHPSKIQLSNGLDVWWEVLEQRDMNANRLTGGVAHPFTIIQKAFSRIKDRWEWSSGHIVVLEPVLFAGQIDLKLQDRTVSGQCATLAPIECVGLLRSGPINQHGHASGLALLWYQTEFGIDARLQEQIVAFDWQKIAAPWNF